MPLKIERVEHAPLCVLSTWAINHYSTFISVLAWLYLRKPLHAKRVMDELDPGIAGLPGKSVANAIGLLRYQTDDIALDLASPDPAIVASARKTKDIRIFHRDGLLFQHISWIAAAAQFPGAKAVAPHVRKADKGFDGVLIELGAKGEGIARLVLCEDKASTDPKNILPRVWKEIREIIDGDRDLEILASVTGLLETMDEEDREAVLNATTWDRSRQFRVAVTAIPSQAQGGCYSSLFSGYDGCAGGKLEVRMAEVLPMTAVRAELQKIADDVIAAVEKIAENV